MLLKDDFIGQYRVIKQIAQTQNCFVYLVHCDALNTQLVVKLDISLSTDTVAPNKQTSLFIEQAKLMHKFSGHKHIVNLMHIGVFEDELNRFCKQTTSLKNAVKIHYIVMPYYLQTLADWLAIQQQKLSLQESIACIEPLLIALTSLHQQGVLHLDIKPQNIFIDDAHQYFLGDFDNARLTNDSPLAGQINLPSPQTFVKQTRLTVKYASPEQFKANSPLDVTADLYSVGVLAYRLLTGKTLPEESSQTLSDAIEKDLKANNSPQWLTELIAKLTQNDPNLRISSAQACLQIVQQNKQQAEDEATVVVTAEDIYSKNTRQLREQISIVLLNQGFVSQSDKEKWLQIYLYDIDLAYPAKLEIITLLIDEIKQELINEKSLGNWFGWVNYLQTKLAQQGRRLSHQDYQQALQVGRASRTDNPEAAIQLMQTLFTNTPFFTARFTRFVIPSLLIVLVFLYWTMEMNSSKVQKKTENDSPFIDTKALSTETHASKVLPEKNTTDTKEKAFPSQSPESVWTVKNVEKAIDTIPEHDSNAYPIVSTNNVEPVGSSSNQTSVNKQNRDRWRYQLTLSEALRSLPTNKSQTVDFEMVKISPNFAVMRNEVSRALYQMCIEEGSCRKATKYSTAHVADQDQLLNHPMVNISWYNVTQEFIPWLNRKTNITFSLPRFAQWQLYAKLPDNPSRLNQLSHCKDCTNRQSRALGGGTISVDGLPENHLGLLGVWGNAQEWLLDCNIQNQIERCDQAIVIGGSWIDNLDKLQHNSGSALLKRAATPTTGFRLIEALND